MMPKKLGLALSGGGFRAAFFHIGILAQMAEQGLLRSVEVISTVSGGSVIGALYYLHVKKLLESKKDQQISHQDYINIIKTIEVDFLKATEKNIRMTTFAKVIKNFQMLLSPNYSRSDRIAELYNQYFYQGILPNLDDPIEMQQLKIYPAESDDYFHPQQHNAMRVAKVPILVINATTLNTGRHWQFTAQTMGEPPNETTNEILSIDKKSIRLRRARHGYQGMVKLQQKFTLGHAVSASACVPGLFSPLTIKGLYYDRIKRNKILPQLIDGGVFDNQGISSLLDHGCTQFVISDASGQMRIKNEVATDPLAVLLRTSTILQDRARTESLLHLVAKTKNKNDIAFIDLRKGLGIREISWINQENRPAEKDRFFPATTDEFGVHPTVQKKIAKIRTDLDAFTEVEAYSLMCDGYLISATTLSQLTQSAEKDQLKKASNTVKVAWKFNEIADLMADPSAEYLKHLDIAQSTIGKIMQVFLALWLLIILPIAGILYYYGASLYELMLHSVPIYPFVIVLSLAIVNYFSIALINLAPILENIHQFVQRLKAFIQAILFSWGGVFIGLYLLCINPLYLAHGRLSKLKK
jgi:NTE family protein